MSISYLLLVLWAHWPWLLTGAVVGLWLSPLASTIPRKVLQSAETSFEEWVGPGGGLEQPVPMTRRIWVPLVNAGLWALTANTISPPAFWPALAGVSLASALLLLALIDWDTTLLPDLIVLPLGLAGLLCSYAGFAPNSLPVSALSATAVLLLLGGSAWLYQRIRGVSGIGGGDLKLLAALAAWWGVLGVLYVVFMASILTVVWYFLWRFFKNLSPEAEWPFGPSIVVASLAWGLLAAYFPS